MTSLPIIIRQAAHADLPFFYSATLQSHFYSSDANHHMLPGTYYSEHKKVLQSILNAPNSRLFLACDEESPDVIMGFCLFTHGTNHVHYIYVKRPFRKFGIARLLLDYAGISLAYCVCSHWTDDATEIWRTKRYPEMVYNPYLLRGA